MNGSTSAHPVPDKQRLAAIHGETLNRMIELVHSRRVVAARLRQAGIPVLATLQAEQRRRGHARGTVES